MARHKKTKKQLIAYFTQYGIHIWAILLIANALMVYTYHFNTHAEGKNDTNVKILSVILSPTPSDVASQTPAPAVSGAISPSVGPSGPTINLEFSVPGIGSGGGNLKPLHKTRNVTVYLYQPNVNSLDPTVNPLYTVQGTATYDSNPESGTYTSFINPNFDLGSQVLDGNYQIAFRTDLSFTTLIKQNTTDIGGEVFSIAKENKSLVIPLQTVLMGDSIPSANNFSFTINDYNAFINCYGDKNTTSDFCIGKDYADFNDDGVVDGIDYNILLRSLYALSQEGIALPQFPVTTVVPTRILLPTHVPLPTIKIKKVAKVAKVTKVTNKSSTANNKITTHKSSAAGIIIVFFLLLLFGAIFLVLYFKSEKVHTLVNNLIHLSPTGTPGETQDTETTEEEEDATVEEEAPVPAVKQATVPASPSAPAGASNPAQSDLVEKDCYIKTKGPDESSTGMWLLLTDDNGPVTAHYNKKDAVDGFAKVKGVMKKEKGKSFLEISEIVTED